jgi:transcription-repair coupling factor (superfamily II helicase)
LFSFGRLGRFGEEFGVISIDRTPDGIALKFSEKARISPEKLAQYVSSQAGATFTPNGVLRLVLTEDEQDNVLDVARDVLLALRATD